MGPIRSLYMDCTVCQGRVRRSRRALAAHQRGRGCRAFWTRASYASRCMVPVRVPIGRAAATFAIPVEYADAPTGSPVGTGFNIGTTRARPTTAFRAAYVPAWMLALTSAGSQRTTALRGALRTLSSVPDWQATLDAAYRVHGTDGVIQAFEGIVGALLPKGDERAAA